MRSPTYGFVVVELRGLNNLWIQYQKLALICPVDLSNPLDEMANLLNITLWHGTPEGVPIWEHLQDAKWRLREAAQHEIRWTEE